MPVRKECKEHGVGIRESSRGGQGEFRRYLGDHVLTENEVRGHTVFPDAVVENSGAFCLHHAGHRRYDFRLKGWTWDTRDGRPYAIPFRCLRTDQVANLLVAGRCISVDHRTHHATKEIPPSMSTGEAAGTAAALAVRRGVALADLPIDVLRDELRRAGAIVERPA